VPSRRKGRVEVFTRWAIYATGNPSGGKQRFEPREKREPAWTWARTPPQKVGGFREAWLNLGKGAPLKGEKKGLYPL